MSSNIPKIDLLHEKIKKGKYLKLSITAPQGVCLCM